MMYPLRFEPVYQPYVWGGTRIPTLFHRPKPKGDRFAESWEVSDRSEGMSVVANGPWKGKTLAEILDEKLVGKGRDCSRFPLLIKIIDAAQNLSVQVHPNEKTASLFKGEPKTEMWVALDSSRVYAGFKEKTRREAFERAVHEERVEELLQSFELHKGDVVFIPGGRVHAICANSLLLEIQQNSNTTYRLYDWGRKGRELHLKEGLASIDWSDAAPELATSKLLETDESHRRELLVDSPFFVVERVEVFTSWQVPTDPRTFQIFFCSGGKGRICSEELSKGMTYLVPAALENVLIQGPCELIRAMRV